MEVADFDYELPPGSIAQVPAASRDASRLLLIDRKRATFEDHVFKELPDLLSPGDCLVVNDSRVIPARVLVDDAGGRPVELLFVEAETDRRWRALVRPGRRCRPGATLTVGVEPHAHLRVTAVRDDGMRVIERLDGTIAGLLADHGLPPLPPYITHHARPDAQDWDRYQTVYAEPPGSIAAPTAGLHFTRGALDRLRERAIEVHALTLHVGPATFKPIKTVRVEDHALPRERVTIPSAVANAVNAARREGRRVVAVGTTTTRALEGASGPEGVVDAYSGEVGLFITPGYGFRVVDALLTNFHLPRSSLLVLVAAFAGRSLVLGAYEHAVRAGYRFYSYGDATLIV